MAAICEEFLDVEASVERIEEPAAMPVRHYHSNFETIATAAGVRRVISGRSISPASAS